MSKNSKKTTNSKKSIDDSDIVEHSATSSISDKTSTSGKTSSTKGKLTETSSRASTIKPSSKKSATTKSTDTTPTATTKRPNTKSTDTKPAATKSKSTAIKPSTAKSTDTKSTDTKSKATKPTATTKSTTTKSSTSKSTTNKSATSKSTTTKSAAATSADISSRGSANETKSTTGKSKKNIDAATEKLESLKEVFVTTDTELPTDEKLLHMLSLSFKNNPDIKIVNPENIQVMIEIMGIIKKFGVDDVIELMETFRSPSDLLWEQETMADAKYNFEQEIKILRDKPKGIKGIGTCIFCKGNELYYKEKQTRGADEPMTVFVRCSQCEHSWTE